MVHAVGRIQLLGADGRADDVATVERGLLGNAACVAHVAEGILVDRQSEVLDGLVLVHVAHA